MTKSNMKHILILDTGKEWGGGTNSLLELLKRVDRSKYQFSALFYHNYRKGDGSDIKTEMERIGIEFQLLEQRQQPLAVKMLKEAGRGLLFLNKAAKRRFVFWIDRHFRISPNARRIASILVERSFDLLYMNNQPSSNLEGIMAARSVGVSVLQHSRIETTLNRFEVKMVNRYLNRMICVSHGVRNAFINQGVAPDKCLVVHNGVDPAIEPLTPAAEIRRRHGIAPDDFLIVAVGSLVKRKRFGDLLEAVATLRPKSGKRITCLVAGEGPERKNLFRRADESDLKGSVIFTGFQNDPISYINAADVFVLPSEKEGLPRVVLEAMAMGKPVVAADVTGPAELVVDGETGFLVAPRKSGQLAIALGKLLDSPGMWRPMGEKGRARVVEQFSIQAYVAGVEKVFAEVVGE
ncbi:MAG: glycosyltransferase [Geobacter sp.]|nr:glycosyltransferase [Geobacter sp.]